MRMFNLKGNAAKRMIGLEQPAPETESQSAIQPVQDEPRTPEGDFRVVWRTDVGKLRKNNQDAIILGSGLAGVADGMGGHLGGEVASGGLRDGLIREIAGKAPDVETLKAAIETVNLELWERQEKDASLTGMGTTLTVLWPSEREMIVAQVGDSRAYLLRGGELKQVTADHSMVADMVRRGILTEEQAACHPMRNYITRAVATEDTVEADLQTIARKKGDRWLVCSDGLHGLVSRAELERMLTRENPEEAANEMLEAALENGGRDNISLVILLDEKGPDEVAEVPPELSEPVTEGSEHG